MDFKGLFARRFLSNVRGDVFGGLTAGIVALPLALGFGVASGVANGPAAGLYGAIALGILASIFGGTPSQISGPTGPMTVVCAAMVPAMAAAGRPDLIFTAVALAGVFQVLFGVLRIGRYVNYIPYPVISGFMTGIGVIIIFLQAPHLLGQPAEKSPLDAVLNVPEYLASDNTEGGPEVRVSSWWLDDHDREQRVAGLAVELVRLEGEGEEAQATTVRRGESSRGGGLVFEGLTAGRYQLRVQGGPHRGESPAFDVTAGHRTRVRLDVEATVTQHTPLERAEAHRTIHVGPDAGQATLLEVDALRFTVRRPPSFLALGLALLTVAIIYLAPRVTRAVPGTLVALLGVSGLAALLPWSVPEIGAIPAGLPSILPPSFDRAALELVLVPAIVLGALGSLDTLLTSIVADQITRTRHHSDQELFGQGIGNLACGLLGGLPGAGATMRTVVNVRSGGRSHLSGVVAGGLLLAVLLGLGPLASRIPLSVLAGILLTVGIGIIDWKGLRHLPRVPRGDAVVMLVVLALTVFVDLMWAVGVGMVLASLILVKRLSDLDPATHSPLEDLGLHQAGLDPDGLPERAREGVYVASVHGSLFFGNAGPLQRELGGLDVRALIIRLHEARFLDQSGAYALADLVRDLQERRIDVFLSELHEEPARVLRGLHVAPGVVPADHVLTTLSEAVEAAAAAIAARTAEETASGAERG